MRSLLICLALTPVALGGDPATSFTWKPAPLRFDVLAGKVEVVLSDPLPTHWALSVVSDNETADSAKIWAGSVQLDGPLIERVNNLDAQRLVIRQGTVLVRGASNEAGLAVCVTVPSGTQVLVLNGGHLLGASKSGIVIRDGKVGGQHPRMCAYLPLLMGVYAE